MYHKWARIQPSKFILHINFTIANESCTATRQCLRRRPWKGSRIGENLPHQACNDTTFMQSKWSMRLRTKEGVTKHFISCKVGQIKSLTIRTITKILTVWMIRKTWGIWDFWDELNGTETNTMGDKEVGNVDGVRAKTMANTLQGSHGINGKNPWRISAWV